MVGEERDQLATVDQDVAGEREAGRQDVRQRLPFLVDTQPPRRGQDHVRLALHRSHQRLDAFGKQHVVVVEKLDVLALRQADAFRRAAQLAEARLVTEVADRERRGGALLLDQRGDPLVAAVVADDQLQGRIGLPEHAVEGVLEVLQLVGRHDDADESLFTHIH